MGEFWAIPCPLRNRRTGFCALKAALDSKFYIREIKSKRCNLIPFLFPG